MYLETLTIGLKSPYVKPGRDNTYEAKLSVSYNDNKMQVRLSDDVCRKILALAGDEISKAAQIQISEFVKTAIAISQTPLIEGVAE